MTKRLLLAGAAVLFLSSFAAPRADARCECKCVNGEMQPLCERASDMPPVCPQRACPIVRPSTGPTPSLQPAPPFGTTECSPAQVYNPRTGKYEWKPVCE